MKRVIVIVLLAIILAMLTHRRENLSACPAGYRTGAKVCELSGCPDRRVSNGDQCCYKTTGKGSVRWSGCMPKSIKRT